MHQAMEKEIDRNMKGLHLDGMKNPFYISSAILDYNRFIVYSGLGTLIRYEETPVRIAYNQVLVGSYNENNLNYSSSGFMSLPGRIFGQVPMDNSAEAIQTRLWPLFDRAYKRSAEEYESKQSAIKGKIQEEGVLGIPDYTEGKKSLIEKPEINLKLNSAKTIQYTKDISAAFSPYRHLTSLWVKVIGFKTNIYYSSSEGTSATYPGSAVRLVVFAKTQLPDGELIEMTRFYHALTEENLPDAGILKNEIKEIAETLQKYHTAPVFDDVYTGPVLFTGQAAGEVIRKSLFNSRGENLNASRKPVKGNVQGNFPAMGGTSAEPRLEKKVSADGFSVVAKPLTQSYEGTQLIGYYPIDMEGTVPREETILIENGILKNLISGRTPTAKIKESNGHCRMTTPGGMTQIAPGVIEVDYKAAIPVDELKKKLMELAKEEGLTYGLIVREMIPNRPDLQRVYKVDVNTGEETLVRSVSMKDLVLNDLRKLIGAGNKKMVVNSVVGEDPLNTSDYVSGIPASFILPEALLFREMELTRNNRPNMAKLPVVKSPMEL